MAADQKRELVQRVVNSEVFRRSGALRAFLLYITEQEILGRSDRLKEQTIGVEVLGRKPDYAPNEDNIVRVRAHELRGRLERYFASEGVNESIVIRMPPGAYAPEFGPRTVAPAEPALTLTSAESAPGASNEKPASRGRWATVTVLLAAILLAGIAGSIGLTRYVLKSKSTPASMPLNGAIHDFWGQFFDNPNEELKIVYADTNFALWQDLNNKSLNLGDYLNRKYLNAETERVPEVGEWRITSPADVEGSAQLAVLAAKFGGQVNLRFARDANTEFLHRGNIVLIGSHRSNPWVELYEPSLNFQLGRDPHSGAPLFRNRSPQPGEPQLFAVPTMFDMQRTLTYGVVALLRGCDSRGLIVLVEGINMQATQAAGAMVTDPQLLGALLKRIGHRAGTKVTPFEALFQITSLPGGYNNPKVIAFRTRSSESCVDG